MVERKRSAQVQASLLGMLCWLLAMAAWSQPEEGGDAPPTYADPAGKFSFRLAGDWVKLPAEPEKGLAGSFVLTKEVAGTRRVVSELLITFAKLETAIPFEEYVRTEDRRAMSTPGFARLGKQETLVLGECPAVRNRYGFSNKSGLEELRHKLLYQYYACKDGNGWGITLTALRQDESILLEVERLLLDSFQFSVSEDAQGDSLEMVRTVKVGEVLGGFSLAVPDSWEVKLSGEEGATIRGRSAVVHAFGAPADEGEESAQGAAGKFLKERENLNELRVLSQDRVELGPVQGYAVEYSGTAQERRWHVRLVTFVEGRKVFFLHCVAPEEQWQVNRGILQRIERSFSLMKPSPQGEGTQ